jgi:hypothetical protein
MLGLTYSLGFSVDPSARVDGNVIFSNMTQSWGASIDEDTTPASQLAAHAVCLLSIQSRKALTYYSMENRV